MSNEFFDILITRKSGKKVTTRIFLEPSATQIIFKDSLLKNKRVSGNKAADDYASFSAEVSKVKPPSIYSTLWKEYDRLRIQPWLRKYL